MLLHGLNLPTHVADVVPNCFEDIPILVPKKVCSSTYGEETELFQSSFECPLLY